jgi:hypothetical protein
MLSKKLELIFKNIMDRKTRISLDEPREDLTELEITSAMNNIITQNIFETTGGNLVSIAGARIITTQIQDFSI